MMHSDNTSKALVVYEPPVAVVNNSSTERWRLFSKIDDFYARRSSTYYSFVMLFFVVSVFSRYLYLQAPFVANEYLTEVKSAYLNTGIDLRFLLIYFSPSFLYIAIAFFGGFTVFSLPLTLLSALQFFYKTSFLFFATVDCAFGLSFMHCFFYVGAYAFIVVAASAFFAETRFFYARNVGVQHLRNAYVVYICLFVLFSIMHFGASSLSFYLLFNT